MVDADTRWEKEGDGVAQLERTKPRLTEQLPLLLATICR